MGHAAYRIANQEVDVTRTMKTQFTTRINSKTVAELRALALSEGIPVQALVEEALEDLLEKRKESVPRTHAMAAYQASHERYATLYERLAE